MDKIPSIQPNQSDPNLESETVKPTGKNRIRAEVFDWVQTFCQALFAVVFIFTFLFRFVTVDGHSMDRTLADQDRLIISSIGYTPKRGDIVVVHDTEAAIHVNGASLPMFRGPIIKRVIATEGETVIVDYDNWVITVIDTEGNTHVLEESYVNFPAYDANGNIGIPKNTSNGAYVFDANDRQMGPMVQSVEPENLNRFPQHAPRQGIYPNAVGNLEKHVVAKGCVFVCGDNRANSLDSRYVGDIDTRKILGKALWRVFPFTSFGSVGHVSYAD